MVPIILGGNYDNVWIFIIGTDSPQQIGHCVKLSFILIRFFPGAEIGREYF